MKYRDDVTRLEIHVDVDHLYLVARPKGGVYVLYWGEATLAAYAFPERASLDFVPLVLAAMVNQDGWPDQLDVLASQGGTYDEDLGATFVWKATNRFAAELVFGAKCDGAEVETAEAMEALAIAFDYLNQDSSDELAYRYRLVVVDE